jgi:hypothetical protein
MYDISQNQRKMKAIHLERRVPPEIEQADDRAAGEVKTYGSALEGNENDGVLVVSTDLG